MKQRTFLLLFVLLSTLTASAQTLIDGIYYNFDASTNTATVTSGDTKYTGSVIIPKTVTYNDVNYSVTRIGMNAFYRCPYLKSVTIPNSVTSIAEYAFSNCYDLTSITIPNSVTLIGWSAFQNCESLTSITIPNSVTEIGSSAFKGCHSLTSISVESGNENYDSRGNCNGIIRTATNTLILGCKNTVIPNSVTSIDSDAFNGCSGLTSITIPSSVKSIGYEAFGGCSGLTSITIPNSVTSIYNGAFSMCSSLTSITIPNSVTTIYSNTFYWCTSLTSITIPNSVTSIEYGAFYGCSGLSSVTIPNSVTSIGSNVFSGCSGLTSVIVDGGNPKYDSRDNCNAIIETASNTLVVGCNNTVIPSSVKSIGANAFSGCSGLTSITIPNSVTSIGESAFNGCSGLTRVIIPNNVTVIGYNVFSGSGLTSIDIPTSVTSIGDAAFYGCSSLTSVTIPNSVTSIGSSAFSSSALKFVRIGSGVTTIGNAAFYDCLKLTDVYCYAEDVPSSGSNTFSWNLSNITLHVPEASVSAYQTTTPWNGFGLIVKLLEQCATPTVSYADGKLTFSCETEGADIHYEYSMGGKGIANETEVTQTIIVSVYATKEGYDNSDVVTKEIEVGGGSTATKGDVNEDGKVNGTDIQEVINIIVNAE